MRTSSGSVVSSRFSKSVHENSRWLMIVLASRASSEICASCLGSTAWRVCAALARRSRARASAASTPCAQLRLAPGQHDDLRDVENRKRGHDDRSGGEQPVNAALVVEGPGGKVGPQHTRQAARSRASRPTSGARRRGVSAFAAMRSINVAALRGSTASTLPPSRCSSARRRSSASWLQDRSARRKNRRRPGAHG